MLRVKTVAYVTVMLATMAVTADASPAYRVVYSIPQANVDCQQIDRFIELTRGYGLPIDSLMQLKNKRNRSVPIDWRNSQIISIRYAGC